MTTKRTKPAFVTQPFLPPLEEYVEYLEKIWDNRILTNNGPFHRQLEDELCKYLGVDHISLFTNGTIALVTALQALRIGGEVITTPYSFVATAHSLLWNNIKPVFVDIDPQSYNLDPTLIEEAITPQTTAIMPVHCYGNVCDVEGIQEIADRYGLRVIYDAAHAFGVKLNGQSVLNFGDMSVLSFHATKVFNTFEGGAIVCKDKKTKQRIDYLKNFGFANELSVIAPGINGKMSEINAAFGLVQLKYIDGAIARRRAIADRYKIGLAGVDGIVVGDEQAGVERNDSYFPILVEDHYRISRDALYEELKRREIFGRRYFYPLISEMPMYRGLDSAKKSRLPAAHHAADRILCLPIYPDLADEVVEEVIEAIKTC